MAEYKEKKNNNFLFYHISTDEVYGSLGLKQKSFTEKSLYKPNSPYSASKASSDLLVRAWNKTYGLKTIISHCSNNYGPWQNPEKFIPRIIKSCLKGNAVTVHANKTRTSAGSRFYIYAGDVAEAMLFLLKKGKLGEKYNIVGSKEIDNLSLAKSIANVLGKKLKYKMVDFHSARPGHDLRYALSGEKMRKMGWTPKVNINKRLEQTVKWTIKNKEWF